MERRIYPLSAAVGPRGFATLVITIILLLVATIATLTVARAGLFEQKYAGLDVRGKEVHAAAVGGLEFGIHWFWANWPQLSWSGGDVGDQAAPAGPADQPPATRAGADSYRTDLNYQLLTPLAVGMGTLPVVVRVTSTASGEADSHVTKTVSADLMLGRVGLFHGGDLLDAPPVVVEGCLSGVTGNPAIHPNDGIAIGTTTADAACIDSGNFQLHGGASVALAEPRSLSEAIFGLPAAQMESRLREIERREPERVYVIDLDDDNNPPGQPAYSLTGDRHGEWRTSLDDAGRRPYILYFSVAAGCPRISGDIAIHGLVYYAASDCDGHDWGAGNIHGTIAVSGTITGLSTTATVHGQAWDFSAGRGEGGGAARIEPGLAMIEILQLPASWRDF